MSDELITTYLAVYGAVVATLSLVWTAILDWRDRKVRCEVAPFIAAILERPGRTSDEFAVTLVNHSQSRKVFITGVFVMDGWLPGLRSRASRLLYGVFAVRRGVTRLALVNTDPTLPQSIEAGASLLIRVPLDESFCSALRLATAVGANDATGRVYWARRVALRNMKDGLEKVGTKQAQSA